MEGKNKKNKIILSVILLFSLNASYIIFINNGGFDNVINYTSLIRLLLSVILICFGTAELIIYANELEEKKQIKENKIKKLLKDKRLVVLSVFMIIFGILFSLIKVSNASDVSILFSDLLKLNGLVNKIPSIVLYTLSSFVINVIMLMILLLLVKLFDKTKLYKLSKLISGILFFIIGIFILVK